MKHRFLFTCWPFEGHVFPQVSIARSLRDRGNEVAFYTGDRARATIEQEGFPVFPFQHVDEQRWLRIQSKERQTSGRRQSLRIEQQAFRNWLVESIPGQVADLEPILRSWTPDVLVTDLSVWAPIVIFWEATPIPVALSSTFMGPLIPGPDAPPWGFGLGAPRTPGARVLAWLLTKTTDVVATPIRRRVDELRAKHGLQPLGSSVTAFTGRLPLYLVGNIPELDYNRRDLPGSVHYVGPCVWHPPAAPGTTDWLAALSLDRPWVHVTEGTSHYQDPFVLRAAVEGLAEAPVEVIATTGRARRPEELVLGPLAPNIHLTQWVSHGDLLPRCAVLVTTGGPATIMAALTTGVPLVVVPTTWDKPDNARRVVEAGVGVRISPRSCTPQKLRTAVEEVLTQPSYRMNARRIAERLAGAPGPVGAAELLEVLAGEGTGGVPPETAVTTAVQNHRPDETGEAT